MYLRCRGGLGFTPDEEKELLAAQKRQSSALDEIVESTRKADTLRTITVVATIGGLLYTLARFGELVAGFREKRRTASDEKGVNW